MTKEQLEEIIKDEGDEFDFETFGLPCCLFRNGRLGHWCGYVQVPKDSRLFGKKYYYSSDSELGISKLEQAINNLDVHGGLTYAGEIKNDVNWWFGFDSAHYGDLCFFQLGYNLGDSRDVYRDKDYCIEQCKNLARQIKKIIDLKL
jgi:hypothetical protein